MLCKPLWHVSAGGTFSPREGSPWYTILDLVDLRQTICNFLIVQFQQIQSQSQRLYC